MTRARSRRTGRSESAGLRRAGQIEPFEGLAAEIRRRPARLGAVRLVAVDGPSGAGKTVFAERLAAHLGGAPVVHTDDLLDGWIDQFTFWERLERLVLAPLRMGRDATYLPYRWDAGAFGGAPVEVPGGSPVVVVEGVSAARAVVRPELTVAVFVTAAPELRLSRGLERDGPAVRAHLERWRAAEDRHFTADRTRAAAELVVDGAPGAPHDPARQYVRLSGPAVGEGRGQAGGEGGGRGTGPAGGEGSGPPGGRGSGER